ncbi:hypothetical protein QOZ88_14465 [Blastococcus sp. BMG 814]|uniref:Oligosaccharide repeat unit polymerase n=1 Tax=Blastococcus carthaginiensis TaxID=3050034 RepID=A0ABT9IE38_9ACTN|nr:hypothetical protein [Blastococcus carthaginiensis]MDP5183840.1 hypothetical protein [Blastococcus carthaginiensis]
MTAVESPNHLGQSGSATAAKRAVVAPLILLGVWVSGVAGLGLIDGLIRVSHEVRLVVVSVALFLAGLIFAAILACPLRLRRGLALLRLGPWICVGFGVVFGLASLVWLAPAEGTRAVTDPAFLVPAALLALAGLASFALGYAFTPRILKTVVNRANAGLQGPVLGSPGPASVLTLWGISVLAQVGAMLSGSFGYLSDPSAALGATSSLPAVLALLADVGLLSTLLAAWWYAGERNGGALALLVYVVLTQVALGLFAGLKESVIIQFVAVFLGYGVRRRVRFLPILIAASLVVVVIVPLITQYRLSVLVGSGRLSPAQVLETITVDDLAASTSDTSMTESMEQFGQRLSRVGDVAVIMQKTPEVVPYQSPVDLAAGPVLGLIPRSLWAGKPVLDAGYRMSSVYYGLPPGVFTSNAMTPYGDLWRHGGPWVVALGMAILGMLVRAIDERNGDPRTDPRLLFLPMLLFAPLVKQEMDYLGLWASLVGVVVVATISARMVATMSRPATRLRYSG